MKNKPKILKFRLVNKDIFEAIVRGKKKIETRAATEKYRKIKVGDTVILKCGKKNLTKKVLRVEHSSQITNLQKSKGISGWVLQTNAVSTVERLLLESIDPDLFDESFFIRPLEQWVDRSKLPLSP